MTVQVREIGGTGSVSINGTPPNDVNLPGGNWAVLASGIHRINNRLEASGPNGTALVNAGSATQETTFSFSLGGLATNTVVYALLRAQNDTDEPFGTATNDHYRIEIQPNDGNNKVIGRKRVAGTNTPIHTSGALTALSNSATISVTATINGNTISYTVDDGINTPYSNSFTDSSIAAGNYAGMRIAVAGTMWMDDFAVDDLAAAGGSTTTRRRSYMRGVMRGVRWRRQPAGRSGEGLWVPAPGPGLWMP